MINTRKVLFLLSQPRLYPEFLRQVRRKVKLLLFPAFANHTPQARAKAKEKATKWCEHYAVDTKEAILRITQLEHFESFYRKFSKELTAAKQIVDQSSLFCPGERKIRRLCYSSRIKISVEIDTLSRPRSTPSSFENNT